MAGLEEKLCPVCFQEAMEHGECRNCGYHAEESSAVKDYLAPFTILKEKYLLGKSLGQGGFGITYLAENMQSGLRCCIKEYFPSGLLQGRTPDGALILADEENRPEYEEGKQQFIEEACALQELRENISVVDIRDFFEENGTAYFAMELIEGCNLRVFRKNHNPKQTLKMALQMLFLLGSSLAEVHRFGMIHGDISPENILITQDGEIKLIDFGAARSFRQGSDNKERKIYLKPNYAPYEQYTQKPCQGPWTDIYALAATFYFRDGTLEQLNIDHNFGAQLDQMALEGSITQDEALHHPQRAALTSYLGISELTLISGNRMPFQLRKGDVLIQCTDGLYRYLPDSTMCRILAVTGNLKQAAEQMVKTALAVPGGHDNTSVLLARYKG